MIKLNLDLLYLTKKFGVSAKKIVTQSQGNSISKIMEEELFKSVGDDANKTQLHYKKQDYQTDITENGQSFSAAIQQ